MQPLLFTLFPTDLSSNLASRLGAEVGQLAHRRFPDGETYLRILSDCQERSVIVCCDLHQPDGKLLELLFLAATLREQQANRIGLVVPYLPYMRQDKVFQPGEAVTSRHFAHILSAYFDWLVTVDPHLHRYASLDEIYSLQSRVVESAPTIADWLKQKVTQPLLIGPDSESAQWVSRVAELTGCPHQILTKTRHDDYQVEISLPDASAFTRHTPVLLDDIVSSGGTMLKTLQHLQVIGFPRPLCIAVHGLFAGQSYSQLQQLADVVSCNTLPHDSNRIDLGGPLADAVTPLL